MLDSFIKGQDQLVQQLFLYYYRSYQNSFSYKELIDELDITYPMLKHALDQVEAIQAGYPEFSIDRGSRTVTITFSEKFLLNKIRVNLTKETVPFIIWNAVFYQKFTSLDAFSQKNYLSRRTVQRQIAAFGPILDRYKIGLNLKKNDHLEGEEYRIRYFFHSFYWHVFDEIESNRPPITEKSASEIYQKITAYFPFIRHAAKERFINLLAVSVTRIKQGHVISEVPDSVRKFYNPFMAKGAFEEKLLLPFFEANFLFSKDLTQEELLYLYYMFTIGQSYPIDSMQKIQLQSPMFLSDYRRLIDDWISLVESQLKFQFGENEKKYLFVNATYVFSFLLSFGLSNQIDSFGDYLSVSEMEEEYHYLFAVLDDIAPKVKTDNPEWTEALKSNSFKYYTSQLLYYILMDYDIPICVAIESKGRGIEEALQKQKLVRLSPRPIIMVRINEEPDVIISDYAIDLSKYFSSDVPYLFQWSEKQYLPDWVRVITFINEVRERKYARLLPKNVEEEQTSEHRR